MNLSKLLEELSPYTESNKDFFMKTIADTSGPNKDLLFKLGPDFTIDKFGEIRG